MGGRSRFCFIPGAAGAAAVMALTIGLTAPRAHAGQSMAALSIPASPGPAAIGPSAEQPIAAPSKDAPARANPTSPASDAFDLDPRDSAAVGSALDGKARPKLDPLSAWRPEEKPNKAMPPVVPAKAAAGRDHDEKGLDPEPDVAIKPPPAALSEPVTPSPVAPVDLSKAIDEPLPPLEAAIKRAIDKREAVEIKGANAGERRKQREAIAFFYAAHAFAPVWLSDGDAVPAVESVLARLAHAGDDALVFTAVPAVLKTKGTPEEIAESELALSEAVVAYARQATGNRIDPRAIAPLIGFKPDLADAAEALETVAAAGPEAGDRLQAFNPSEPRYVALREKLAELRAAHTPASASSIPAGPDLRIGMRDPRVPLIRARFSLDGTPDSEPQDLRYDTEVAAAVADFQRANGLPASGVLTKRTIVALSGGHPSRLEGELVANMEMWRWMPRDLGADRIEVNVPDFAVTVFQDNAVVSKNRVVVGKTNTPTPLFSNAMQYLIVNPVWNVPDSIIKKEMLPKLAVDPDYLDRLGYSVVERNGKLIVKQPSGEKNALGRVKFMFPNDYAVYLHDTPSKALFASARRAFSHGCVRVDQPFRFAQSVLGADKGWSEKRLKSMLGDKERYVYLPRPLPIHIEYFTASVDETGHLDLRDDVYDYIHKIKLALGQDG